MEWDYKKVPSFESLEELIDFLESTDLGDYIDSMQEVEFDVCLRETD